MSGLLFEDVGSITLDELIQLRPKLYHVLAEAGVTAVEPLGSTGLSRVMGDVDLAVEHAGGRAGLLQALEGRFQLRKVGSDLVSIRYPISDNRWVQVDLMVGRIPYLTWARAGSTDRDIKNSCRAVLMNIILRFASERIETQWDELNMDRTRYALDFGSGLYLIDQTRRGKEGRTLKEWKTLSRTFVTDEPREILDFMFGCQAQLDRSYTFSGVVNLLKESSLWTSGNRKLVFDIFMMELKKLDKQHPSAYGDIAKVEQLVHLE